MTIQARQWLSTVICASREHIRSPLSHLSPALLPCVIIANSHLLSASVAIQIQISSNREKSITIIRLSLAIARWKHVAPQFLNKRAFVPTYGELELCFSKFARECLFSSLAPTMCWVSALNRGCENRPAAAVRRDRIHRKAIVCRNAFVSRHLCIFQSWVSFLFL